MLKILLLLMICCYFYKHMVCKETQGGCLLMLFLDHLQSLMHLSSLEQMETQEACLSTLEDIQNYLSLLAAHLVC